MRTTQPALLGPKTTRMALSSLAPAGLASRCRFSRPASQTSGCMLHISSWTCIIACIWASVAVLGHAYIRKPVRPLHPSQPCFTCEHGGLTAKTLKTLNPKCRSEVAYRVACCATVLGPPASHQDQQHHGRDLRGLHYSKLSDAG